MHGLMFPMCEEINRLKHFRISHPFKSTLLPLNREPHINNEASSEPEASLIWIQISRKI